MDYSKLKSKRLFQSNPKNSKIVIRGVQAFLPINENEKKTLFPLEYQQMGLQEVVGRIKWGEFIFESGT